MEPASVDTVPLQLTGARPSIAPPGAPVSLAALSTGLDRLDTLLGGGYPGGASTLLYGAPYTGKQVLQQVAFAAAARRGIPATFLLHGVTAEAMSRRLQLLDPRFAAAERHGNVTYIDAHSHFLGERTQHPNAVYVEDPYEPAKLAAALEARAGALSGLFAVQSASTIVVDLGQAKALQFLRGSLGRVHRAGGVGLVALHAGMHADSEVQMAKSLCAGMIELRKRGDVHCLHVDGLETTVARPGWIHYEATPRSFRLTGSFATRTIH